MIDNNNYTKVSDITAYDIANYLRICDPSIAEIKEIEVYKEIAEKFIMDETGLTNLDEHNDFIIVIYILCQDMYDNRTLYVDKNNTNKLVENILGKHRNNLL